MLQRFAIFSLALITYFSASAQIVTPGTGVSWNMDSLVEAYPAAINNYVEDDGVRYCEVKQDIIISPTDTLMIRNLTILLGDTARLESRNAVVEFNAVVFNGLDSAAYPRMRFDSSQVSFRACRLVKGGGIDFVDAIFDVSQTEFIETLHLETGIGSAISLFRSQGVIRDSRFEHTARAAISSGLNGAIGVLVRGCTFIENNTDNKNVPQLSFGDSAPGDSIVIRNNIIIGGNDNAGGIGISNLLGAETKVIIAHNVVRNNRYGITIIGYNVVSSIHDNTIVGNNIQHKPQLGGSGINLYGDESNTAYIGRNHIEGNLWGLTIQAVDAENYVAPLAYLSTPGNTTSPYPTSENSFIDNGNNGQIYALFNMNDDTIYAEYNYWNTTDSAEIEDMIFHKNDDKSLGLVIYSNFLLADPDSTNVAAENIEMVNRTLKLIPNPVKRGNAIYISQISTIGNYKIYNGHGKIVKSGSLDQQLNAIDINLPPGQYFLIYTREDEIRLSGRFLVIE